MTFHLFTTVVITVLYAFGNLSHWLNRATWIIELKLLQRVFFLQKLHSSYKDVPLSDTKWKTAVCFREHWPSQTQTG